MRLRSRLACMAGLLAIQAASVQQPPVRTLTPDLQIGGPDEGQRDYTFSVISGIAFDRAGRILITDLGDDVVRVYTPEGKFAYRFGGAGAGPGEFHGALSGVFSRDGLFWVRDEDNRRWNAFELGPQRATFRTSVRYEHDRPSERLAPVGFDAQGRLISTGTARNTSDGTLIPLRTTLDRSGRVIGVDTIRMPPGDSLGSFTISKPRIVDGRETARTTNFYFQPYGSFLALAYAPNGEYARAVSSRYDVEWRDAGGRVLRRLRRDVIGPELSARERRDGQETVDGFLARTKLARSDLPHGVPDRKAPISAMAFDQLGRLWVMRSVKDGAPREADVYDTTGQWISIVRWPPGLSPDATNLIAAQGNKVLAVARDSMDVAWVVRLTMK